MARRWVLGRIRRFRLRARLGLTVAPFPPAPLKFRTAGFPQYGFKRACPAVKCALPDSAGLTHPSCRSGYSLGLFRLALRHVRPGLAFFDTTLAHGAFAPRGLCCPAHQRYYAPIRPTPVHRLTSHSGYRAGPCHYGRDRSGSLLWFGLCPHVPSPMRRRETCVLAPDSSASPRPSPRPHFGSAPSCVPTLASVGVIYRRCSVRSATARVVARPPVPVRPGAPLRPPRTLTPELARTGSPSMRVGHDYAAPSGDTAAGLPPARIPNDEGCTGSG